MNVLFLLSDVFLVFSNVYRIGFAGVSSLVERGERQRVKVWRIQSSAGNGAKDSRNALRGWIYFSIYYKMENNRHQMSPLSHCSFLFSFCFSFFILHTDMEQTLEVKQILNQASGWIAKRLLSYYEENKETIFLIPKTIPTLLLVTVVPHRLGTVGKDNPKCMWMALSHVLPFILPFFHHVSQSVSQLEVKEAKIHKT